MCPEVVYTLVRTYMESSPDLRKPDMLKELAM